MKHLLMTIPGHLLEMNETGIQDLVVYYWEDELFPYYISYKKGGDLARFDSIDQVFDWLRKYVYYG